MPVQGARYCCSPSVRYFVFFSRRVADGGSDFMSREYTSYVGIGGGGGYVPPS
jgi:hypothetical protein